MRFDVLTLFPEIFSGYLTQSLLKLAIDRGLTSVHTHNLRDWATGKHKQVDDKPFGGGPGMLLMPGPVVEAVEAVQQGEGLAVDGSGSIKPGRLLLMTPQGRRLDQAYAEDLATSDRLLLLCGRYEGFDERVTELLKPEPVSIGDYVLNGGEVAAMTIIDAVVRLVPGVLGDETSNQEDSFSRAGRTLEYAQYTRPREYRGLEVPEVLLSGNHQAIAAWREQDAQRRTAARRDQPTGPTRPQTEA